MTVTEMASLILPAGMGMPTGLKILPTAAPSFIKLMRATITAPNVATYQMAGALEEPTLTKTTTWMD